MGGLYRKTGDGEERNESGTLELRNGRCLFDRIYGRDGMVSRIGGAIILNSAVRNKPQRHGEHRAKHFENKKASLRFHRLGDVHRVKTSCFSL
jgi:hypothetical protein